jgi:hypothetical protein
MVRCGERQACHLKVIAMVACILVHLVAVAEQVDIGGYLLLPEQVWALGIPCARDVRQLTANPGQGLLTAYKLCAN